VLLHDARTSAKLTRGHARLNRWQPEKRCQLLALAARGWLSEVQADGGSGEMEIYANSIPARCVSHKGKTLVVYHKGTVNFPCGIFSHKALSSFQGPLWYFVI